MDRFSKQILAWYDRHGRHLPWRSDPTPYRVWISEIMLQQTRVEAVIPYFEHWLERFPDVHALARASEQEVLSAWEGLGYYRRARNLLKAARMVVAQYSGRLPSAPAALRELPGVGRYTAAAIASIAFGADVATLDGNLRRVFARVYNVEEPADTPAGEEALWVLAEQNLPPGRAGDYNQALMDLGATVCLPRKPACGDCPVSGLCRARRDGVQEQRPVRKPKKEVPHHLVTAAVLQRGGTVLLARRPAHGLLGGMWEFPGGKVESGENLEQALQREIREELDAGVRVGQPLGTYKHAYSHFRITLHAFLCELEGDEPHALEAAELRWVSLETLEDYPMGKVDRQIARRLAAEGHGSG
ncbi:MAG: A/G-specific adenine glycosylase [Anaerolineales bacterium]|nr:A/G-specific adenine glycosylase [Anaerolineales bacterium]